MRNFKYQIRNQSNIIRIGNMLDDMWQVHEYFHKWQRQRYKDGEPYAKDTAMAAHLTELKRTTHPHWNALPSQAIQEELKRIDEGYQRLFKGLGGCPHIKRKDKFKSLTYPGKAGWQLDGNHRIRISFRYWCPKKQKWRMDYVWYTFHKHREIQGNIRKVTVKRDNCGDYWLILTTNSNETEPMPTTGESVGADFGIKDESYLTLSTGEKIASPQFLKRSLDKLRQLTKSLSRKVKGSNNWYRAVLELARLHRKIARQRKDWHWKLATDLCRRFDLIATETLNIAGMKRLWGRKVSDLSFSQFVSILAFKCEKHEKDFRRVGRWTATTKPCSACGYHNENLKLSDREWTCPACKSHHDRDVNAAINILRAACDPAPTVETV